jgi:hypothetical protein
MALSADLSRQFGVFRVQKTVQSVGERRFRALARRPQEVQWLRAGRLVNSRGKSAVEESSLDLKLQLVEVFSEEFRIQRVVRQTQSGGPEPWNMGAEEATTLRGDNQ